MIAIDLLKGELHIDSSSRQHLFQISYCYSYWSSCFYVHLYTLLMFACT